MSMTNMEYLNKLLDDHKAFEQSLEEIKDLIKTKDIEGIASRMNSLKNNFMTHLKEEDNKIYADLLKVAREKDIELIEVTINTFTTAMKGVAARISKFFDKYAEKKEIDRLTTEFHKDFQGVYEDLMKRIGSEEKVLYLIYKKYCC